VYHQCLQDSQSELQNLAFAELDESVKRESTTSANKPKGATHRKNKKKNKKQDLLTSAAIQKVGDVSLFAVIVLAFCHSSHCIISPLFLFLF
jgi:hypothetical protein